MGEIRCYGILLEKFDKYIRHVPEKQNLKTPDFIIDFEGQQIEIEVATLQMDGNEAKSLSDFEHQEVSLSRDKIIINEHITKPYGNKKSSGTTPSAIYKLTSIKQEAEQLSKITPCILWIDCQDEEMSRLSSRLEIDGPIYSSIGLGSSAQGLRSNEIWYSLYAKENDLILDDECLDKNEGIYRVPEKMKINGRFNNEISKRISGVIFSGPNAICLYKIHLLNIHYQKCLESN